METLNSSGFYNAFNSSHAPSGAPAANLGQSTVTTQQSASPALDANIADLLKQISGISSGLASGATGMQNTYTDSINALTKTGNRMAGAQGSQASTGALASGLTPLQAGGAGRSASNDILMQMFPQIAALHQQQAQVPYQLQKDISQYAMTPYNDALTKLIGPYQQAVAGSTQTTTNPLAYLTYQLQQQEAQQQANYQRGQLANAQQQ